MAQHILQDIKEKNTRKKWVSLFYSFYHVAWSSSSIDRLKLVTSGAPDLTYIAAFAAYVTWQIAHKT
jgi:hypothetical protein